MRNEKNEMRCLVVSADGSTRWLDLSGANEWREHTATGIRSYWLTTASRHDPADEDADEAGYIRTVVYLERAARSV